MSHEARQILARDTNDVYDADVREQTARGPFVDRGGADSEYLGDLSDREELLDRR